MTISSKFEYQMSLEEKKVQQTVQWHLPSETWEQIFRMMGSLPASSLPTGRSHRTYVSMPRYCSVLLQSSEDPSCLLQRKGDVLITRFGLARSKASGRTSLSASHPSKRGASLPSLGGVTRMRPKPTAATAHTVVPRKANQRPTRKAVTT